MSATSSQPSENGRVPVGQTANAVPELLLATVVAVPVTRA